MPVKEESMVRVSFTIPQKQADRMHALVESGDYPAGAEAYREAVRRFLDEKKSHQTTSEGEACPATL